jgi:hypothetical protein
MRIHDEVGSVDARGEVGQRTRRRAAEHEPVAIESRAVAGALNHRCARARAGRIARSRSGKGATFMRAGCRHRVTPATVACDEYARREGDPIGWKITERDAHFVSVCWANGDAVVVLIG